jgi:hypothetical protein
MQEGLYKGFIAPVVLFGALGVVMLRNRKTGAPGPWGGKEEKA